ncbi:MAG: 7-cyano-7-deazaguanine synthase, partial [Legionellaceae bacterium]
MKKAIVLLSGGLDSTTCLALATSEGYHCTALSFDYGQRHLIELTVAKK